MKEQVGVGWSEKSLKDSWEYTEVCQKNTEVYWKYTEVHWMTMVVVVQVGDWNELFVEEGQEASVKVGCQGTRKDERKDVVLV